MKNLILDGNNLVYRAYHSVKKDGDPELIAPYCMYSTITMINKYYREHKVDRVILALDSKSWRKHYTKDTTKTVTNKKYKGHRREKATPEELKQLQEVDSALNDLEETLRENTKIVILRRNLLEADDLIAGFVQMFSEDENIVISTDKDFIQLLRHGNTKLITPDGDKRRSLSDWDNDADLFLFEKCIRGEAKTNDNVQSSYPRLRKTKLIEAYYDEYKRENIMNHTFTQMELVGDDYKEVEYNTREVFKENRLLMDLEGQPEPIKKLIEKTIKKSLKETEAKTRYNYIKMLQFCNKYEMVSLQDNLEQFSPLFSGKSLNTSSAAIRKKSALEQFREM